MAFRMTTPLQADGENRESFALLWGDGTVGKSGSGLAAKYAPTFRVRKSFDERLRQIPELRCVESVGKDSLRWPK